jgi:hypothetical protein
MGFGCAVGSCDFGLVSIASVVDQEAHTERVQDVGCGADVIGVRVGDPEDVDRGAGQIGAEPVEQVMLGDAADVAAAAAMGRVAGVEEEVVAARKVDEGREALRDIVEVDDELPPGPAVW